MSTENAIIVLRKKVKDLENTISELISTLNANDIQKSDIDRLRGELIQLKEALTRGDFDTATARISGLVSLTNNQVALTS